VLYWEERFLNKAIEKHGDLYNYDNVKYEASKKEVVIGCNIHGNFFQKPKSHLEGHGCKQCAKDKTLFSKERLEYTGTEFYNNLPKTHSNKFFNLSDYTGHYGKMDFICSIHGHFNCSVKNFLKRKYGCVYCTESLNSHSRSKFIALGKRNSKGKATLYIIKCCGESEVFYKVGITSRELNQRFSKANLPYDYEVMQIIKQDAGLVWDLEKWIIKSYADMSYKPKITFSGSTECFICG
jgi:hypothetical protein